MSNTRLSLCQLANWVGYECCRFFHEPLIHKIIIFMAKDLLSLCRGPLLLVHWLLLSLSASSPVRFRILSYYRLPVERAVLSHWGLQLKTGKQLDPPEKYSDIIL